MARRRMFGSIRKLPSGRWQATYLDPTDGSPPPSCRSSAATPSTAGDGQKHWASTRVDTRSNLLFGDVFVLVEESGVVVLQIPDYPRVRRLLNRAQPRRCPQATNSSRSLCSSGGLATGIVRSPQSLEPGTLGSC